MIGNDKLISKGSDILFRYNYDEAWYIEGYPDICLELHNGCAPARPARHRVAANGPRTWISLSDFFFME